MSFMNVLWFLPVCWAFWRGLMDVSSSTLDEVIR